MGPGGHHHRWRIGIHAFDVAGRTYLAAAYLEEYGGGDRYRYAVLCGGEVAVRALGRTRLDPSDSDEPGPRRRVALATYADCDDFLYRLPMYVGDVIRVLQLRMEAGRDNDERIRRAGGHC